ncbi:putative quinone oxidoreductase YhfP [compost metagenome]
MVALPDGLSPREAMAIGTAGFTAALSVRRLLDNGLAPGQGPVLVLGATGGVGSMAVAILSRLGFAVTAVTGKPESREKLIAFGAVEVLSREKAASGAKGVLGKERWAAIVDPVGGAMTADLLKSVRYGGSVALSGLTGGGGIETSVYPFILRGINLLGIDSVFCPEPLRHRLWQLLSGEWKPEQVLTGGITEYSLEQLPEALNTVLAGKAIGRQVISLN